MADYDAGRDNPLPIAVELRIDGVCDRFEAAWQSGGRPRIEEHLGSSAGEERSALLAELVALEIAYRQRHGESPGEEEYQARFPGHAQLIRSVFEDASQVEPGTCEPAKRVRSSIAVTCPGGHTFRVKAKFAGRSGECPYCDQTVQVPARAPAPEEMDTSVVAASETIDWQPAGDVPASSARLDEGGLPEGQRIGRFELIEVLGKGAFGTVYRAYDPRLEREVALKVPRKGVFDTEEELERFLREARSAATLRHPNICPVYETGREGDHHYIAMAYIAGKPLASFVAKGKPLGERKAAVVVRKLALALEEAHRKGIIHRDLKPSNIMIDQRGEPVIMDFGLARRAGADDAQLTQTGQILGTPAYMPPEQACGELEAIGPASDVYSLGVILYELLCGQRPFQGSVAHLVAQILCGQPEPPSALRPELDPRLNAICLKAIAKAPEDRFGSMREFAEALTEHLRGPGTEAARAEAEKDTATEAIPDLPSIDISPARPTTRSLWLGSLTQRRGKSWLFAGAGALAGLILLGGILTLAIPRGTLVVETLDDDVKIAVLRGGQEVTIIDTKTDMHITLRAGQYELELFDGKPGLQLSSTKFTLTRGDRVLVRVELVEDREEVQLAAKPELHGPLGPSHQRRDQPKSVQEQMLVEAHAERSGPLVELADEKGVRIDRTTVESPQWRQMIRTSKELPPIRSGHGQMTLMRVILEGGSHDNLLQLTSTKLVLPAERGGGGLFKQIRSGDFVLVEHINSSRRRQGRDPVEIGTLSHHRPTIWVEVPPRGTLGVLGDVIISPFPEEKMGRIVATVASASEQPLSIRQFCFGPVAVGGPYGKAAPFDSEHVCDTGLITPGEYKILLPDFDVVKSRWTVNVSPGNVTYLRFLARSQRQVEKTEESIARDAGLPRARPTAAVRQIGKEDSSTSIRMENSRQSGFRSGDLKASFPTELGPTSVSSEGKSRSYLRPI